MSNRYSERNKTLFITDELISNKKSSILKFDNHQKGIDIEKIVNRTILGDSLKVLELIPNNSVDLIVTDPPYNLSKKFNKDKFSKMDIQKYALFSRKWILEVHRILKEKGSIYVCSDWTTTPVMHQVLSEFFIVRNRITWKREKGRGAGNNWKNVIEDIIFATKSNNYVFNAEDVKIKKKVVAPYKDDKGAAKDWYIDSKDGLKYRLTHHGNVWTDITIPFWSMSENTEHPTQKPEKLIAKLVLASSRRNDIVLDPFLGSGTTSVVAKKLGRKWIGIEKDEGFASISQKRIDDCNYDDSIQGYNSIRKYFDS